VANRVTATLSQDSARKVGLGEIKDATNVLSMAIFNQPNHAQRNQYFTEMLSFIDKVNGNLEADRKSLDGEGGTVDGVAVNKGTMKRPCPD
jgi:hypothetical protein